MPSSRSNIILIILGILLLLAGAYLLFGQGDDGTISVSGVPSSPVETVFVNLTAQLDPVQFNTSIISDPRFKALQDIRTSVVAEPTGRTDPFGPIPGISSE